MSIEWSSGRIEWNDAYRLGVAAMDDEHKALLDLVNAVEDSIEGGAPVEETAGRIETLCEQTILHFAREEDLMAQSGFDGLDAHQAIHQKLQAALQGVAEEFAQGRVEKAQGDLLEFSKIFFASHIPMIDAKYVATVNE